MTENSILKKQIIQSLYQKLINLDFKVQSSNLIRETDDGVYQIITFSLGPSTSIMSNHIGISFGIATDEWIENLNNWKRPKQLTVSDCEIRDHNCKLLNTKKDSWFKIIDDKDYLLNAIGSYVEENVMPVLNKLKYRKDIIDQWKILKHGIGLAEGREYLAIGTLMLYNDNIEEGKRILEKDFLKKKDNDYFTETINKVLEKKGIEAFKIEKSKNIICEYVSKIFK